MTVNAAEQSTTQEISITNKVWLLEVNTKVLFLL